MEEFEIDGPVSDGVSLPFEIVVQPTLTVFRQVAAPAEPVDEFMTAGEAAAYLKVHPQTFRKWVRLGVFPRIPLPGTGKDFRFSKKSIDAWAEARMLGKPR